MSRRIALVSALLLVTFCVTSVWAHAYLDHAEPKVGSTGSSPKFVKIWFSEPAVLPGSKIRVLDAAGLQVDRNDLHVDPEDDSLLIVSLPKLAAGVYSVKWEAVCVNHHHTHGAFQFSVSG